VRAAIEETRGQEYAKLIGEVQALDGAHELIADLKAAGWTVVLASSSPADELDRYLDLLDARDLADAWTTKDDVQATKLLPTLSSPRSRRRAPTRPSSSVTHAGMSRRRRRPGSRPSA
jgi:phosphoglycolate phosphatase-like HAD superfamily hydrolase